MKLLLVLLISSICFSQNVEVKSYKGFFKRKIIPTTYIRVNGRFFSGDAVYTYNKPGILDFPMSLSLSVLANQRVRLDIVFESFIWKAKEKHGAGKLIDAGFKCDQVGLNLIGEADGFGGYALYKNSRDYVDNKIFGELTIYGDSVKVVVDEKINLTQNCYYFEDSKNYSLRMTRDGKDVYSAQIAKEMSDQNIILSNYLIFKK